MASSNRSALLTYGSSIKQAIPSEKYPYDGTAITSFISRHNGNWREWREFLKTNKVGSVFDILDGQPLVIPDYTEPFTVNPNG